MEWEDEYYPVYVSLSMIDSVREYIRNQEKHHKQNTFQEEYEALIEEYKFEKFKDK